MAASDLELVSRAQAFLTEDMKRVIDDPAVQEPMQELVDPEAEVRFHAPDGGVLGDRQVPEHGVEGLREGWRDWMQAWEQFWIRFGEMIDLGEGRVLSFGELSGRLPGGAELTQPGAALIAVRDGKIVSLDFYVDQDQARRDAGVG